MNQLCVYMLNCFSPVRLFVTLWTVASQASLSMEFFQAGILEWFAMLSSRGSSWPRDQTRISYLLNGQVSSLSLMPPGRMWSQLYAYISPSSWTSLPHALIVNYFVWSFNWCLTQTLGQELQGEGFFSTFTHSYSRTIFSIGWL